MPHLLAGSPGESGWRSRIDHMPEVRCFGANGAEPGCRAVDDDTHGLALMAGNAGWSGPGMQ